jgi:protein-tyrosine phosphatase
LNGVYRIYGPSTAAETGAPPASLPLAPMPLAVVLCPRGGHHLRHELAYLRRSGIQTLVSLLSEDQVHILDLALEPFLAKRMGMQFLHHPLPDHEVPPDIHAFRAFVSNLASRIRAGEHIGIHCWGSIGRATVTAACTLIHLGWSPGKALAAIEAARGLPVPDTEEQERWILNYRAQG